VRRKQRGFTLIEIIVALTILAMSILLVTRAFLVLLQGTNSSGNRTVAASLAVRMIEQTRALPESQSSTGAWVASFDSIVPTTGWVRFGAPYANYEYQLEVNDVDLNPSSTYPCWLTAAPMTACAGPNHENTIKFLTVSVRFNPDPLQSPPPLAEVSSAVIRDMYRRP
jgi:prepilin-type N-terminal cleavage/methylation domain-containing protein